MSIRLGLAELFVIVSLFIVAALLTLAFLSEWTIALVPAITYVLAIGATYMVYRQYARERAQVAEPVAVAARFQVVDVRGACPLGRTVGEAVTVDAGGSVAPHLCPPAEAVLRLAAAGEEPGVKEWCCPIFDHMLVFRRELKAA